MYRRYPNMQTDDTTIDELKTTIEIMEQRARHWTETPVDHRASRAHNTGPQPGGDREQTKRVRRSVCAFCGDNYEELIECTGCREIVCLTCAESGRDAGHKCPAVIRRRWFLG